MRFDASQLMLIESQWATPSTQLVSAAFSTPGGIAFDASGNLWVANRGTMPAALMKFPASLLSGSGVVTALPSVTIQRNGPWVASPSATIVFDPPPPGLPLP